MFKTPIYLLILCKTCDETCDVFLAQSEGIDFRNLMLSFNLIDVKKATVTVRGKTVLIEFLGDKILVAK